MKKPIINISIIIILTVIVLNFPCILSLSVMTGFNRYNRNKSLLKEYNIDIKINNPMGSWYPLMNCFVPDNFDEYIGKDIKLTILYSFPGFKYGASEIFNTKSELYNSFYGCYIIDIKENFGFNDDNTVNVSELLKIPEFDYKFLVVGSMGIDIKKSKMEILDIEVKKNGNVTEIYSEIYTNGIYHKYKDFNSNYLQYGKPIAVSGEIDFEEITLFSKMYVIRKDEYILIYYIFSPTKKIVEKWKY